MTTARLSPAGAALDFDPRQVPVTGVDAHLPPVPNARLQAPALRQRFASPPVWQPELRGEPRFSDRLLTPAAVLVPLVQRPAGLTVLLTQRTQRLSSHSGQIAFPGGKVDAQDASATAAALREAQEEIDLAPGWVDVLGQLPPYLTGSRYRVTPVVALVRSGFALVPNPDEVAEAFEVPLAFLMNPAHHRHHRAQLNGQARQWLSMPYADPDSGAERFIWGATAGMLRNLYRFLAA